MIRHDELAVLPVKPSAQCRSHEEGAAGRSFLRQALAAGRARCLGRGILLRVAHGEGERDDFIYAMRPLPSLALAKLCAKARRARGRYCCAEVSLARGAGDDDVYGFEVGQAIADAIQHYDQFRHVHDAHQG